MGKYAIEEATLQSLADAIRSKTGTSLPLSPSEMVDAINGIIIHNNNDLDGLIMRTSEDIESNTATYVANYSFFNNLSVRYVVMPNVESVGEYAFYGCGNLENVSVGAIRIGAYAFYDCDQLLEIIFDDALTEIGVSAFDGCLSLTGVDLSGSSVPVIPASCFANTGITEFRLPEGRFCGLANVNAFSGSPIGVNGVGGTIYVPMQYRVRYESNSIWSQILGNGKNRVVTY